MRKKLLAAGSTVLLVAGLMSLGAGAANAWHSTMSGSAVCNTSTGEYTVTYEGDVTSWPDDYTVKATVVAPAGSTVSPADQSLAHAKTFTVTQIVPGTATSAKVNFGVTWTTATGTIVVRRSDRHSGRRLQGAKGGACDSDSHPH